MTDAVQCGVANHNKGGGIRAANNRIGIFGNSFVATDTYSAGSLRNFGFGPWVRQKSRGAIDFSRTVIGGNGGDRTDVLRDTYLDAFISACITKQVGAVVLMLGSNDPSGSYSTAISIANINDIINACIDEISAALGWRVIVILCDEQPRSAGYGFASELLALSRAERLLHNPSRGVYVANTYNATADGFDGLTPVAGTNRDGTHYSIVGAELAGEAVWSRMRPLMPSVDLFSSPGLLFGGDFGGAGGTMTAWAGGTLTGSAPTGYTLVVTGTAGTVNSTLIEDDDGVHWWDLAWSGLTNGASAASISFYGSANQIAAVVPGTDYMDSIIAYELDAGASNFGHMRMVCRRQSGNMKMTGTATDAADAQWVGSISTLPFPDKELFGILRLPHSIVAADATLLAQRVYLETLASQTSTGRVRFALPQFRKYTGLLLD